MTGRHGYHWDQSPNKKPADHFRLIRLTIYLVALLMMFRVGREAVSYHSLQLNVRGLAAEINHEGPKSFVKRLIDAAALGDVHLTKSDVDVTYDAASDRILVAVPYQWNVDFVVWTWSETFLIEHQIDNWPSPIGKSGFGSAAA